MSVFLSIAFVVICAMRASKLRERDWGYKMLYWGANFTIGCLVIFMASKWCNGWEYLWGIPFVVIVNLVVTFVTLLINPLGARELRRKYKVRRYACYPTIGDAFEGMEKDKEINSVIELEIKTMDALSVLNPYYNIGQVKVAKDALDYFLISVKEDMDMDSYYEGVRAYLLMHTPLSIQGSKFHREITELIGDLCICIIYRRTIVVRSAASMGIDDFKCPYDEEMEWRRNNLK